MTKEVVIINTIYNIIEKIEKGQNSNFVKERLQNTAIIINNPVILYQRTNQHYTLCNRTQTKVKKKSQKYSWINIP